MKYLLLIFFVLASLISSVIAQNDDEITSINICAIRVQFQQDDNDLTTGDGHFIIDSVTTDPYAIDPAPHNRLYFQDQLLAAANYFKKVSNGRVAVTGDVFPLSDSGAYQLPHKMGYYNPNTIDAEINRGIGQLFIDAVEAADISDDINFNNYDLVVVFHAGVGKDIALDYDPTPQDISSLFVTQDFIKKWLGDDVDGAQTNEGLITQGIILPETENQEGEMIALTGLFVSNIGTYLGLYDLFSPSKQRTGVGRFDLMDSGLLNLNGLAPSPPGAFSRMLLGWTEPVVVSQPEDDIRIARYGTDDGTLPEIVQIPINDNEYYLLEYRGDSRVNIDSLFIELLNDSEEYPSYLEVLKKYYGDEIDIGESGVLVSMPDYDWGLPGAGILIWHVDEKVIAEKGPSNDINDDPDYRAVDVEEADGSQDIGQIYTFLEPGYQTELGWAADFWFSNRPEDWEDFELYQNKFATNTSPNTRANLNNAKSYISLENFSTNNTDVMSFDFNYELVNDNQVVENGFPLSIFSSGSEVRYALAGSFDESQTEYLFVLNAAGGIYAVGSGDSGPAGIFGNDFLIGTVNGVDQNSSLVLANTTSGSDLLVAASVNHLVGFSLNEGDTTNDGGAGIEFEIELPNQVTGPAVYKNDAIYIPCSGNKIYRINLNGQLTESPDTNTALKDLVVLPDGTIPDFSVNVSYAAAAALESADQYSLVLYNEQENEFSVYDPSGNETAHFKTGSGLTGQFILADMDNNNLPDIVYILQDGIYAYSVYGYPISGFPIRPKFTVDDYLTGTPLVLDANDDDIPDLVCSTRKGQVLVYSINGQPVEEYQLSTGGSLHFSPIGMQLDNDDELELLAVSDSGTVYAWQMAGSFTNPLNIWRQANLLPDNNVVIATYSEYKPVGSDLMPAKKVFNYPNPNKGDFTNIRYYLNEQASVKIRIFDAAGILVDEFSGPGSGQTANEIPWDVSNIASGVYVCQVEAKSQSTKETRIIKIMVIH